MKRRLHLLLYASLLAGLTGRAAEPGLEYKVKAVCVLNAARFIEWPRSVFKEPGASFVIGVLGDNPFGPLLEAAVKNETIRHRPIVVRHLTLSEAAACQILFISRSERDHLPAILQALGKASVLTISEIEGFTRSGGMLGLALEEGKVRFQLNPAAARAAQLRIDSQFMMLCRVTP